MATIHFILQGKGGVGKSMVASILYQALGAIGNDVIGYDTDPVNATLSGFKEFDVKRIDILDANTKQINKRRFDDLLDDLAAASEDSHVVVDNGASSFIALGAYMLQNNMVDVLYGLGHEIYFHTIITGGQGIGDTISGFLDLATGFPQAKIVVWLNPFFGAVEVDNKSFTDFNCYQEYQQNIHAIIELPMADKELIGKDLEILFAKRHSFEVGMTTGKIAERSRIKRYWQEIVSHVEEANIC